MDKIATDKYSNLDNQEYWNQRSLEIADAKWKDISKVEKELKRQYKIALDDIQKELQAFISRYADESGLTFTQANQALNQYEISNYQSRMNTLKQQIEAGANPFAQGEIERLVKQMQFNRYQSLLFQIDSRLIELAGSQQITMEQWLMGTYESVYYQTGYNVAMGTGVGINFTKINEEFVKKAITYPWSGQMFSERIWGNRTVLVKNMRETITNGLIRGTSNQKMSRELAKKMDASYKNALRLIRTETNAIVSEATAEGYVKNGIEQYMFLGTLDNKISQICASLDGKVFDLKEKQLGVNCPSLHPHCRSTIAPFFGKNPSFRRARNADGKNEVIPFMTFDEWKKNYVN